MDKMIIEKLFKNDVNLGLKSNLNPFREELELMESICELNKNPASTGQT